MEDEKTTKPTIETVLERISEVKEGVVAVNERVDVLEVRMNERADAVEGRLNERIDKLEEHLGGRIDRVETVMNATRADMLEMRTGFREMKNEFRALSAQIREHFPAHS